MSIWHGVDTVTNLITTYSLCLQVKTIP